jgi:hypothetical protein
MSDFATNEERDEIFENLFTQKENTLCFDCNMKNPAWASVYLGVSFKNYCIQDFNLL